MHQHSSNSTVLLLTLIVGLAPINTSAAEDPPRSTDDSYLKLLYEGKIDQAAWVLGFGELGGANLIVYAERARAAGKTSDALGYYEAYLRLFPFAVFSWENYRQEVWSKTAIAYIELLAQSEKPAGEWFKQSQAALKSYKQLREAYAKKDAKEYTRLTEEILTMYPRSIFSQAAVMTTCWGRDVHGHGGTFEDSTELLRAYLAKMERIGIPEDQRLLVMLLYQQRLNHRQVTRGDKPSRVVSSVDVVRLSSNPLLRRAYLWSEITDLLAAKDKHAARKKCQQYLDEFPAAWQAEARLKLVDTYLKADDPAEALWWVQQWGKNELPDAQLAVADYYAAKGQWKQAVVHYEEGMRAGQNSPIASRAKLGLAVAFGAQGKDEKMVTLLKEVANLPAAETLAELMKASYTRNRAREALAEYYMRKKDWQEAMTWWQRWEPTSFCGTCYQGLQKQRADNIETCRKNLQPKP